MGGGGVTDIMMLLVNTFVVLHALGCLKHHSFHFEFKNEKNITPIQVYQRSYPGILTQLTANMYLISVNINCFL